MLKDYLGRNAWSEREICLRGVGFRPKGRSVEEGCVRPDLSIAQFVAGGFHVAVSRQIDSVQSRL